MQGASGRAVGSIVGAEDPEPGCHRCWMRRMTKTWTARGIDHVAGSCLSSRHPYDGDARPFAISVAGNARVACTHRTTGAPAMMRWPEPGRLTRPIAWTVHACLLVGPESGMHRLSPAENRWKTQKNYNHTQ